MLRGIALSSTAVTEEDTVKFGVSATGVIDTGTVVVVVAVSPLAPSVDVTLTVTSKLPL